MTRTGIRARWALGNGLPEDLWCRLGTDTPFSKPHSLLPTSLKKLELCRHLSLEPPTRTTKTGAPIPKARRTWSAERPEEREQRAIAALRAGFRAGIRLVLNNTGEHDGAKVTDSPFSLHQQAEQTSSSPTKTQVRRVSSHGLDDPDYDDDPLSVKVSDDVEIFHDASTGLSTAGFGNSASADNVNFFANFDATPTSFTTDAADPLESVSKSVSVSSSGESSPNPAGKAEDWADFNDAPGPR